VGPLKGFKIIEIAGIGPGQLAGMLLADMGANVIRIDRPFNAGVGFAMDPRFDILNRSRPLIRVDLKSKQGSDLVLDLCADADAIFEGFRPGAMERLGLGPAECMARNPRLVYGRMTGWGQDGPLSGAILVMGMLAALLEASKSGRGQVVDAAMIDGAASQMGMIWGLRAAGMWQDERGSNILDGGAPFSCAYKTSDGQYIAVAPIENRFYRNLLESLGIDDIDPATQYDASQWGATRQKLQSVFATKTRDEWCELLDGTDTCCTPILTMSEVASHPHNTARKTFVEVEGIPQPGPAPRFSRTRSEISQAAGPANPDIHQVLSEWGASAEILAGLR